jgi:hypothetical protein
MKPKFKVGDIVCMSAAGGWGYHPKYNGKLAIVTDVNIRDDISQLNYVDVESVSGTLLEFEEGDKPSRERFSGIPVYDRRSVGEGDDWTIRFPTEEELNSIPEEEIEL